MSTARLPVPGGDDNVWGTLLNEFLEVEHNADGTLRDVVRPAYLTMAIATKADLAHHHDAAYASRVAIDATSYGWSPSALPATNDTAIANAIADAMAQRRPLYLGRGSFRISVPIDLRSTPGNGDGIEVYGTSRKDTEIVQMTDTADIVRVGCLGMHMHDMTLRHNSHSPSASTGDGVVFYKSAYSTFRRLQVTNTGRAFSIYQGDVHNPGESTGAANWMFSNTFEEINVLRYSKNALHLHAYGSRSTGSTWTNVYLQNVSVSGVKLTSSGPIVDLFLTEESVFNQLNLEDCANAAVALLVNSGGNVVFNSLHIERVDLGGCNSQFIRAYGSSGVVINGLSVSFCDVALPAGSGTSRIFSAAAGGRIDVRGVSLNYITKSASRRYTMAEIDDANTGNSVEITYPLSETSVAFDALTDSAANAGMKRIGDNLYNLVVYPKLFSATLNGLTAGGSGQSTSAPAFVATPVPLGTVELNKNMDVSVANAIKVPADAAGLYSVTATVKMTGGSSAQRSVNILVNGVTKRNASIYGINVAVNVSATISLAVGDVVSLAAYVESASTIQGAFATDTNMTMTRLPGA
jgi:hypothetical protein